MKIPNKLELLSPAEMINLSEAQLAEISAGLCPDCGAHGDLARGWLIGPMAGHQINITCVGRPAHRFNVAFYSGKAVMGHRL